MAHFSKTCLVQASPPALTNLSEGISSSITANRLGTACKTEIRSRLSVSLNSSIAFDVVLSATHNVAPAK